MAIRRLRRQLRRIVMVEDRQVVLTIDPSGWISLKLKGRPIAEAVRKPCNEMLREKGIKLDHQMSFEELPNDNGKKS